MSNAYDPQFDDDGTHPATSLWNATKANQLRIASGGITGLGFRPASGASYIIFLESAVYYRRNGLTGEVDDSNASATTLIQAANDALVSGGYIILQEVQLPGGVTLSNNVAVEEWYHGIRKVYSNIGSIITVPRLAAAPSTIGWDSTQLGYEFISTASGYKYYWNGAAFVPYPSTGGAGAPLDSSYVTINDESGTLTGSVQHQNIADANKHTPKPHAFDSVSHTGAITDAIHGVLSADLHSDSHVRSHVLSSASDHTGTITDAFHGSRGASLHTDSHALLHKANHVTGGGADAFAVGDLLDGVARHKVYRSGVLIGTRRGLNIVPSTNMTITVADVAGSEYVTATFSSTGGGGGGTDINLAAYPPTDLTGEGVKITGTAGEDLAFGVALYVKVDGKYWKSSASAASTMPIVAVALATISTGAAGSMLLFGTFRDDSKSWTVGGLVYGSVSAGVLTQTAPSGSGKQVQVVGIAITSGSIILNSNYGLVELT